MLFVIIYIENINIIVFIEVLKLYLTKEITSTNKYDVEITTTVVGICLPIGKHISSIAEFLLLWTQQLLY